MLMQSSSQHCYWLAQRPTFVLQPGHTTQRTSTLASTENNSNTLAWSHKRTHLNIGQPREQHSYSSLVTQKNASQHWLAQRPTFILQPGHTKECTSTLASKEKNANTLAWSHKRTHLNIGQHREQLSYSSLVTQKNAPQHWLARRTTLILQPGHTKEGISTLASTENNSNTLAWSHKRTHFNVGQHREQLSYSSLVAQKNAPQHWLAQRPTFILQASTENNFHTLAWSHKRTHLNIGQHREQLSYSSLVTQNNAPQHWLAQRPTFILQPGHTKERISTLASPETNFHTLAWSHKRTHLNIGQHREQL